MRLNTILKINAKLSGNYPYSRHPCIFQDATRRPQKPAFEFVAKGSEKKGTTKAPRHKVFRACPSCVGKQKSFLCAFVPLWFKAFMLFATASYSRGGGWLVLQNDTPVQHNFLQESKHALHPQRSPRTERSAQCLNRQSCILSQHPCFKFVFASCYLFNQGNRFLFRHFFLAVRRAFGNLGHPQTVMWRIKFINRPVITKASAIFHHTLTNSDFQCCIS